MKFICKGNHQIIILPETSYLVKMLLKMQSLHFNCLPHFCKHLSVRGVLATCSKPNNRTTTASFNLNLEQHIQGPLKVSDVSVDVVFLPLLIKVTLTTIIGPHFTFQFYIKKVYAHICVMNNLPKYIDVCVNCKCRLEQAHVVHILYHTFLDFRLMKNVLSIHH